MCLGETDTSIPFQYLSKMLELLMYNIFSFQLNAKNFLSAEVSHFSLFSFLFFELSTESHSSSHDVTRRVLVQELLY